MGGGDVMTDPVGAEAAGGALRHWALLYRGWQEYLAAVTGFMRAAIGRKEPVLAAVPGRHIGALERALGAAAPRVSFADITVLGRNPAALIPAIRAFADQHQGRPFSCLGEPAWPGRTDPELIEAAKHEALVNLAFEGTPASLLCLYDAAALPAAVIADGRSTHPEVSERGERRTSDTYLGPHGMPERCEKPLAPPPAGADELSYDSGLRAVRALVTARALGAGLAEERAADLVLAVSEVAANTLRHTHGGGKLSVWSAPGEVLCEIRDSGRITDPLAGRIRRGWQLTGRQGLWVVNRLCDLVEARSGRDGTTVRMHMALPRPPRDGQQAGTGAGAAVTSGDQETAAGAADAIC
jgi:anti-sigma regulatory factor (Ser/Thr protein kinase)